MSTNYKPSEDVSFDKLRKDIENINGVSIKDNDETSEDQFCITDDENYLWCYRIGRDDVEFARYGSSYVDEILDILSNHLAVDIISEHDEGFWEEEDFEQIEEDIGSDE